MLTAREWRRQAQDYREMAERAGSEIAKVAWMRLVESCDQNARDVDEQSHRPPRLPDGLSVF